MTKVLSRWSLIPLQITGTVQHGCLQQLGSELMAEEFFTHLFHVKISTEYESFHFQNAYQIYTFATSQFITTCYLVFNSVTQECKLTWSAILIIIVVGGANGAVHMQVSNQPCNGCIHFKIPCSTMKSDRLLQLIQQCVQLPFLQKENQAFCFNNTAPFCSILSP